MRGHSMTGWHSAAMALGLLAALLAPEVALGQDGPPGITAPRVFA